MVQKVCALKFHSIKKILSMKIFPDIYTVVASLQNLKLVYIRN